MEIEDDLEVSCNIDADIDQKTFKTFHEEKEDEEKEGGKDCGWRPRTFAPLFLRGSWLLPDSVPETVLLEVPPSTTPVLENPVLGGLCTCPPASTDVSCACYPLAVLFRVWPIAAGFS
jgi:hypothetical protein